MMVYDYNFLDLIFIIYFNQEYNKILSAININILIDKDKSQTSVNK